jgi:hypothetical protein
MGENKLADLATTKVELGRMHGVSSDVQGQLNSKIETTDARLSDARPASDVPAWAKAGTKPVYTAAEVGAVGLPISESDVSDLVSDLSAKVETDDSRLADARVASDVSAWAKAGTKPAYTPAEVGASAAGHGHPESEITNLTDDLGAKETPTGAQDKVNTHAALIAVHGMGAKCLTSDFTTSSTTRVSTNLSFPIAANEVFVVDVFGTCKKATSATGLKFAVDAPAGCTIVGFQLGGGATLAALPVPSLISAINTLGTALATGTNIQVTFALRFRVVNGANAGAITIQAATVTSNTATIYAGAAMFYQRATPV